VKSILGKRPAKHCGKKLKKEEGSSMSYMKKQQNPEKVRSKLKNEKWSL